MIAPSDIVRYIDARFPNAQDVQVSGADLPPLDHGYSGFLYGLVQLLGRLDEAVIPSSEDLTTMEIAKAMMSNVVNTWVSRGGTVTLGPIPGNGKSPVLAARIILVKCRDEVIPKQVSGLEFIDDSALRDDLRSDMAAIESALASMHWKVAMVLGGSASEAILLDVLRKCTPEDIRQAVSKEDKKPADDMTLWHLPVYARVARRLSIISERTLSTVLLAQEYRNLIHAGRAVRTQEKPCRSTALLAQAALESIVENLSGG